MAKRAIDIIRLQKMTERGRQKADKKKHENQMSEDQRNNTEAKDFSDRIIGGLPARIKKEARQGFDSLTVSLLGGYQLRDKVKRNIWSWCLSNSLSVTTKEISCFDDFGLEDVLVISWPKKK